MQTLTYVSRRLQIYGRPKRGFVQPLVFFAWKKVLGGSAPRKPWNRFFRPKHIIFPPAQAVVGPGQPFAGGRTQLLYYTSRRVRAQVRHKLLPPLSAVIPPVGQPFAGGRTVYLYYTSRRIRLSQVRLRRNQYPVVPASSPGVPGEVHNRYFFADVGSLMSS